MEIAIVILNWNGKTLLQQFLPSVISYSQDATIYVADNASTDDSIDFIKTTHPNVKIIQNDTNGGYAKGYNDALKTIKADVFCLLNSDVEVTAHWLDPIIEAFTNDSTTSIIQPKIIDFNNKQKFEYAGAAGGFIDKYGFPYCRGRIFNTIENDNQQYDQNSEIFWASGACLFIRRTVFEDLNGFDEFFFAHMEEIDLCWRAFNQGYRVNFVSASKVYHVGGATLANTNPKKTYLNFRNSLLMLVKNLPKDTLFTTIFTRLVLDGIASILFLFQGKFSHTFAVLRSHFSFYRHLFPNLKKRQKVNNKKKYYTKKSIVWDYFVNKKRTYDSL